MEHIYNTLAFYKYKNFIMFLLLAITYTSGITRGVELLSKQDVDVYKHLNHDDNHTIATFLEDNGDIIDCIDIYKQPSLAHPLLKNHKVQLKPRSTPIGTFIENPINISSLVFSQTVNCPKGYVPIKRTSEEDRKMSKYLLKFTKSGLNGDDDEDDKDFYDAKSEYIDKHYGAKGFLNVWSLSPFPKRQLSIACIWVADSLKGKENDIVAGWIVYPGLFKDSKTRLFIYWSAITSQNFGCFNTLCPGFVQINHKIQLGSPIRSLSVYNGKQYVINIEIYQDRKTKHWWLKIRGENIGYWPTQLFTSLKDGANYASWGGRVISPSHEPSSRMGSGQIPVISSAPLFKFEGKVAYIRQIKVNSNGTYEDPLDTNEVITDSDKFCYNLDYRIRQDEFWQHHIYYGGPGNCSVK